MSSQAPTDSVEEAQDWKLRYLDQLDELESKQTVWADLESRLHRSISRLAAALYGVASGVDPQLDALREALRVGAGPDRLDALIEQIHDTLDWTERTTPLAVSVSPSALRAGVANWIGRAGHPLEPDLAKGLERRAGAVAGDADLGALFDALGEICSSAAVALAAGLGDGPLPRAIPVLSDLLDRLELPESFHPRLGALRERLGRGIEPGDLPRILGEITGLVGEMRDALQRQRVETEGFLLGVNRRLGELGEFLARSEEQRTTRLADATALRGDVSGEVRDLRNALDVTTSLSELKSVVDERLESISVHIERHVRAEQLRGAETEVAISELRQRLSETEAQAGELRETLAAARAAAQRDSLTGLYNRAAYDARIAEEHARFSRYPSPLSLALWDIDHFKSINDRFGHRAGDRVLETLGRLILSRVRRSDFVARYGGEEIVVVMPETGAEQAIRLCEELREQITQARFRHADVNVVITASVGVTEFRPGDTPGSALERADRALYEAKAGGRNLCRIG